MNIAMLVLRLVVGLLYVGHGLQKVVPQERSPRLLAARGLRPTASGFEQMGLAPGALLVALAAFGEIGGGFLLAAGLVTPLGTALIAAVMTVAILKVHLSKGIWNSAGGLEFPLLMLTAVYVVSAIGPGGLSIDSWAGIGNWAGIHWAVQDAVRAGAAVGIGAAAGLLSLAASRLGKLAERHRLSPVH
jgi:putative oxidoreductase